MKNQSSSKTAQNARTSPKKAAKKVVISKVSKKSKKPRTEDFIKSAVPLKDLKKVSFNTPNLFENDNPEDVKKRILIFTPMTGLVRAEWVQARYAQIIPTNWSYVDMQHFLSPWVTIGYQLADAQNLMAKEVVEGDYEWVIYVEHDNILPPDAFLKANQYINEHKVPVMSGLYFLKSDITEPLLYRGRGTSYFKDWKLGDKVWVDGIPFGFRVEHASLIKAAWKESPEIIINGIRTREVFKQPSSIWQDPETGGIVAKGGTTDLEWCTRLMKDKLFEKAGWPEFQKKKYPFLVDSTIFVKHIDQNGVVWPRSIPGRFVSDDPKYKGQVVDEKPVKSKKKK